ncbi:MAG TPA: hypothetical protein VFB79_08375 [Candidatus Angelobacter sp.]|nr:hypothetical protein [Candidatus Angelobacter sp.]
MTVLDKFESAANELHGLLDALPSSAGGNSIPVVSAEWMQQAKQALANSSSLFDEPLLDTLKSAPQVKNYRAELLRLKATMEEGQQQLGAQCSIIRAEQMRLKRLKALANTLEKLG